MRMQARISEWQKRGEGQKGLINFESIKAEAIKREQALRLAADIKTLLDKVPVRFRDKAMTDYQITGVKQERVKMICERFIKTFPERLSQGTSMTFLGNPGTGKTLLSLIIYQTLVKAGYAVQYEPSLHFLRKIQQKQFESYAAYQAVLESYSRPQLLILDEVTESTSKSGYLTHYEKQLLFSVINNRYQDKRCTIVISNGDKEDLKNQLGDRIVDRLSEHSITAVFDWHSFRTNVI